MYLFVEGPGDWAARMHLDTVDDVDIEVLEKGCGKVIITVRIAFSECPEGIMSSFDYDGTRVYAYDEHNIRIGRAMLDHGCAKIFGWTGKPIKIIFGDFKQIPLEYENQ